MSLRLGLSISVLILASSFCSLLGATRLIFPRVLFQRDHFAGIASAFVDFIRADGAVLSSESVSIAGRGALQAPLSGLFPISYTQVVALRVRSDQPVVCYGYVLRQSDNTTITIAA